MWSRAETVIDIGVVCRLTMNITRTGVPGSRFTPYFTGRYPLDICLYFLIPPMLDKKSKQLTSVDGLCGSVLVRISFERFEIFSQPKHYSNVYFANLESKMQNLFEQIAAHFQINLAEIAVEPIHHGKRQKQNVCRLKIKRKNYLLKQHDITEPVTEAGFTPFQIEKFTLSTLYKGECLVPRIIWESEQHQALLLEWRGDQTLDSLAQSESLPSLMPILQTIPKIFCHIEEVFRKNEAQFKPYIFHFDFKQTLQRLLEQGRRTIGYLEHLSKTPLTSSQVAQLDAAWDSLSNHLLGAQPTLGGLDYQAHNIVIDDELPYFIDFASVGWDWQERRLVQFFNSIGASQEGANFVSLLNRELVDAYAEWVVENRERCSTADVAARVDGHHLLFYLSVVNRILEAVARSEVSENQILLEAWGDVRLRFQQAMALIINADLSDFMYTTQIREMIGKFQADIT